MKWFKAVLTLEQKIMLEGIFLQLLFRVPRPQTTFMYQRKNEITKQDRDKTTVKYEIYFTPDCKIYMNNLIRECGFEECERPIRSEVIGICTVEDFEDFVWA